MAKGTERGAGDVERRSIKGLLVKPRTQLQHAFMLVGGGMIVLTLFIGIVAFTLHRTLNALSTAYGFDAQIAIDLQRAFTTSLVFTFVLSAMLSIFVFAFGVQLTNRIFGPMVPFQRHIDALKAGDFKSRVQLRKADELIELQSSLNELAASLEARFSRGG